MTYTLSRFLVELDPAIAVPSDEEVCRFLQAQFMAKVGPEVTVSVRPVAQIEKGHLRIISNVDRGSIVVADYI